MTVDPSHQLPPPEQKNHSKKFKIIGGMALFFLIVGIAIFLWWLLWGRFHESTNDAYVNGNMVVITAQISGTINKVYADDTSPATLRHGTARQAIRSGERVDGSVDGILDEPWKSCKIWKL